MNCHFNSPLARESKSQGYDNKTLKKIIARRKMDRADLVESDSMLELYEEAIRKAEKAAFDKSVAEGA